jgi:hypothetical protein
LDYTEVARVDCSGRRQALGISAVKRSTAFAALLMGCGMIAACHGQPRKNAATGMGSNHASLPIYSETPQGQAILAALERGDPQTLANYPRLCCTANEDWAESVNYSVALALQRNPAGVLALADTQDRFDTLCQSPLIEPTDKAERAFIRAAVKALRSISSKSPLAARRAACVQRLREKPD